MRMPHQRIGDIGGLPSRAMHASHDQCVFTKDDVRRESANVEEGFAAVRSKSIREKYRFEAHLAAALPGSHARHCRIAEVPRMRLDRSRLLSRQLAAISGRDLRIIKWPDEVAKRTRFKWHGILGQIYQDVCTSRAIGAHLPRPTMVEVSRRDLQYRKRVLSRQIRRAVGGGRIDHDHLVRYEALRTNPLRKLRPVARGVEGGNDDGNAGATPRSLDHCISQGHSVKSRTSELRVWWDGLKEPSALWLPAQPALW